MEENYSSEEYSKAYTELLIILKSISRKDLNKIPRDILQFYINKRDKNHNFVYNENLQFEEQNIMKLTMTLFANIYIKYLATDERREEIESQDKKELQEIEIKKQEMYSVDKLFKKRKENQVIESKETDIAIVEKKSIFIKIIEKVKKILKLT